MKDFGSFPVFVFFSISMIFSSIYAEDTCVKKSPCICEFSNGTGIDLSESAKSTFFTTDTYQVKKDGEELELSTYYYHPCYDVMPKLNTTGSNSTCGNPLSICYHVTTMKLQPNNPNIPGSFFKINDSNYEYMGTSNITDFSTDGQSIIYTNGPSSTVVMLVCTQTEDQLHVYSLEEPNKIALAFYSRNACLRQIEEVGRSVGSTLCIIFFSFLLFYIVVGVCTKKFLMGATGVEVIPNLGFWSDLPNLVKDGWAFVLNGFKLPARGTGPATSPDPNSYDSI